MARPSPMIVTMLTAKIETSVTCANPRSAVKAPRIAVTPIASGRLAAAKLPKITTSSTTRIGSEIISACAMSALTCSLMSRLIASRRRPDVSRPGGVRSSSISSRASPRAGPRRRRSASGRRRWRAGRRSPAAGAGAPERRRRFDDVVRQGVEAGGDRVGEGRVVDGQLVAGVEDDDVAAAAPSSRARPRRRASSRCRGPRTAARSSPEDAGAPDARRRRRRPAPAPPPSAAGGTSLGRGPRTWRLQC